MFAHYYKSASNRLHVLEITPTFRVGGGKVIVVKNKAEAKKVAKEHNAKPWNF